MFCENCGQPMNDGERFCPNCGAIVSGADPVPNTYVQPHPEENAKKPLLIVLLIVGILSLLAIIGLAVFFMSDAHKINKQLGLAEKYLDDSDYEEAINALTEALELDEDNSDVKSKLKKAYKEAIKQAIDEGDYDYADELIEEANDLLDTSYFDKYLDELYEVEYPAPAAEEVAPAAEVEYAEEAAAAESAEGIEEFPEPEYEMPSEAMVKNVLDTILDWTGLQYFYDPQYNYNYLGELEIFEMAAWAAYHDNCDILDYNSSGAQFVPRDMLQEYERNLFGLTVDSSGFSEGSEFSIEPKNDGSARVWAGDWGLVSPVYEIQRITDLGHGEFEVYVYYYAYDWETDEYLYDPYLYVTYTCQIEDESAYGFIITDMATHY